MPARESWLVRTTLGEFKGPFSDEELRLKLKEGLFSGEDEVCRAGDYWFHLHERSEVISKLGGEVPVFYPRTVEAEEDLTQTETETTAILQTDPAHDFGLKTGQNKIEQPGEEPSQSKSSLSLWKILAGVFLLLLLARFLLPILRAAVHSDV